MDGAVLPNNQDLDDDTNINQQENASLGNFSTAEKFEVNSRKEMRDIFLDNI